MQGLGLGFDDLSVGQGLPSGIPVGYTTEAGVQYVTENGSTNYVTEG